MNGLKLNFIFLFLLVIFIFICGIKECSTESLKNKILDNFENFVLKNDALGEQKRNKRESDDFEEDEADDDEIEVKKEQKKIIIYACDVNDPHKHCNCEDREILCKKQNINSNTIVKLKHRNYIYKVAGFRGNNIGFLRKGHILPGDTEIIERLWLFENQITKIEAGTFDEFDALFFLNLEHNLLTELDDSFLTEKVGLKLEVLQLHYNKIQSISPKAFINLKKLDTLILNDNNLPEIKKEIFPESLANLDALSLADCQIKTIDNGVFDNLKSLTRLLLRDNPITSIPKALNGLPNLSFLDLSQTQIVEFKSNEMNKENKLVRLNMFTMPNLTTFGDCAFCGLPNLKTLYCWNCQKLSFIHENAFGALTEKVVPQFDTFELKNTNITSLPEKLLNWEAIKELNLIDNPFMCDCSMAWLIDEPYNFESIPTCANPSSLANLSFVEVRDKICLDNKFSLPNEDFLQLGFPLIMIIVLLAFLAYIYRIPKTTIHSHEDNLPSMAYRNLVVQEQNQEVDEIELRTNF